MRAALAVCLSATAALAQLGPVPVPPENPITPQKAVLGKILFWDEQLSVDGSVACATCHEPESGGTDARAGLPLHPGADRLFHTADDIRGSPGVVNQHRNGSFVPQVVFGLQVQVTSRLAPPAINAGYHANLFDDGRANSRFVDPETFSVAIAAGGALESQALGPFLNPVEMAFAGRTWNDIRQRLAGVQPLRLASNLTPDIQQALQQNPTYPALFAAAFGDPAITAARIAFALATYERTLVADQTPWDDYMRGNLTALSAAELAGWSLFQNQARCATCHAPPLFSDDAYHNLGLRPWQEDAGRMATTAVWADRGAFKTPSLRNVGLRRRGFHDGSMPALGTAAANDPYSMVNLFLGGGGPFRDNLDPQLFDLSQQGVTAAMLQQVEAFLITALTDPRVAAGLPPFDHPTLRSRQVPTLPQHFGQPLAGTLAPFLVDSMPRFPGNSDHRLGLAASPGSGLAVLGFGVAALPQPLVVAGVPLQIAIASNSVLVLGGNPGEPANLTLRLPIPDLPGLYGFDLYAQLFVLDPSAAGGIAASQGYRLPVR